MKTHLSVLILSISIFSLIGCSSSPITRESHSNKFNLLKSGTVKKENVESFKNCLVEGFEVKNRIAYNVQTNLKITSYGYRLDSVGGETYLLMSVDIFNSGKTQLLKLKKDELTDLSQQIRSFDSCLSKY